MNRQIENFAWGLDVPVQVKENSFQLGDKLRGKCLEDGKIAVFHTDRAQLVFNGHPTIENGMKTRNALKDLGIPF